MKYQRSLHVSACLMSMLTSLSCGEAQMQPVASPRALLGAGGQRHTANFKATVASKGLGLADYTDINVTALNLTTVGAGTVATSGCSSSSGFVCPYSWSDSNSQPAGIDGAMIYFNGNSESQTVYCTDTDVRLGSSDTTYTVSCTQSGVNSVLALTATPHIAGTAGPVTIWNTTTAPSSGGGGGSSGSGNASASVAVSADAYNLIDITDDGSNVVVTLASPVVGSSCMLSGVSVTSGSISLTSGTVSCSNNQTWQSGNRETLMVVSIPHANFGAGLNVGTFRVNFADASVVNHYVDFTISVTAN